MVFVTNSTPAVSAILLILSLVLFGLVQAFSPPHKKWAIRENKVRLPNGPKGRPILGSLAEWLVVKQQSSTLRAWLMKQADYGEMTTLHMGSKTWILLNTQRVAHEIFGRNTRVVNERPHLPIASGLVSRNQRFVLKRTEEWRKGRRLTHALMNGPSSRDHHQIVQTQCLKLIRSYHDRGERWFFHNYNFPVSVMYRIVTGLEMELSDKDLNDLQNVTSTFLTSINSHFVDFFPQLSYVPRAFQAWRPHWEAIGAFHYHTFQRWWDRMRPALSESENPSFIRDVAQECAKSKEETMYLVMPLISAGADNPRMALNVFIMACLDAPDKMQIAREELDKLCGTSATRLPKLDDIDQAPYMCAVVKEVLRWRPIVPLVPQRVLSEDLTFEGFHFPAGTEFLVNSISICSHGYDEPQSFMPERWLKNGSRDIKQDLWGYAFTEGHRMCVGYRLAQQELFLAMSQLLYCFDISPNGNFDSFQLNHFRAGEPFPVNVTARTKHHATLIQNGS